MPDVSFVTLHSRQDLLSKSIMFLNQEWPRSYASREHSQKKSCRQSPPMSFLLINTGTNEIMGHARVTHLPNRPHALWIESVMIRQDLRGRGLGKQLMHETEKWMLENGFDEAFLCTEDQCRFYGSLGYEMCDRIVHSTTATSVFPAMEHFQTAAAISKPKAIEIKDKSCPAPPPSSAPPPPPPPPKMAPKTTSTGTSPINFNLVDEQYMRKRLKPL